MGLGKNYSVSASLPVIYNRGRSVEVDESSWGVGDLLVSGRTSFGFRLAEMPLTVHLNAGATLPVSNGISNAENRERNFASGTVDPTIGAAAALGLIPGLVASLQLHTRQVLYETGGDQSGDLYLYGLKLAYSPVGNNYEVHSRLQFLNRGQDVQDDVPFMNSGGDWIYLAGGLSRTFWQKGETSVRLWGEVDVPLYAYVNGSQLVETWNLRFGLAGTFALFGHSSGPGIP